MRKVTEINRIQVLDSRLGWVDVQLGQVEADDVVREFDPQGNLIPMPNDADGRRVYATPKLNYYSTPCIMCLKVHGHPEFDDPEFPPLLCVQA